MMHMDQHSFEERNPSVAAFSWLHGKGTSITAQWEWMEFLEPY